MKNLSRVGCFILFFYFFVLSVQSANPSSVVINEIAWMGTKIEGIEPKNWWRYEWLELYNNTQEKISLDGWKIEFWRNKLDWSLELKGTILAQGYFLIVSSDKIFSNYDLNYSNLGGKLNNDGQKVLLKDNLGNIVDEIDCSQGWFAGDNKTKQTMERKNPQIAGSDPNNWQTSQNPGGTPKGKNSLINKTESQPKTKANEQPITYPSGIIINEILPAPQGPDDQKEWIEIFNQNQFEVDLSGWKIKDSAGTVTTFTIPDGTKIPALGFLVFSRPITKIVLNNDGDEVSLLWPDGKIVQTISYSKAPRGQSYSRIDSEWIWTSQLTPGKENALPETKSETKTEIKKTEPIESIPKEKETSQMETETAAIGEKIPKDNYFVFFVALSIAIFSGIIILILKRKLKKS